MPKCYVGSIFKREGCNSILEEVRSQHKWVIGEDVCPETGKTYYRFYFETERNINAKYARARFRGCDLDVVKGNAQLIIDSCCIDGNYEMEGISMKGIHQPMPKNVTRLYNWQDHVCKLLNQENGMRMVWVFDPNGRSGKTVLAKHLMEIADHAAYREDSSLMYSVNKETDLVVFEFNRYISPLALNYSVFRRLSRGYLCDIKPKSAFGSYIRLPAVVVLAGFLPDSSDIVTDKWIVVDIRDIPN